MKIIYLKPLSGYATPLRSDTLWGMLCWGIRYLWGESALTQFLDASLTGKPPFVVSSTFPFKQYGKDRIPFFPNPLPFLDERVEQKEEAQINAELRKKYKTAFSYVNLDDFSDILKGVLTAKDLSKRLCDIYDEEERLRGEEKRTGKPKEERRITSQEVEQTAPRLEDFSMTHNTINRLRGGTLDLPIDGGAPGETAGQLFHSPEHYWTDKYADPNQDSNTGIFFLADGPDTSKLEAVLRLFRHWGFGADRTSGKGFFDADMQDFTLPQPVAANAMLNLSLLRPTGAELTALDSHSDVDKRFRYRIELREGWVGTDGFYLPKQPYRYFTEGSVFPLLPLPEHHYIGALIPQFDKPHPVYDNGFGFMVPLKWPV
jgi:CRISPR-associated protein Csm4